ncbi:PadR family transcriptional regulator [Salicibibacter cibarius]|uniref:PadR family transcriptional regulator n=1 Tax=Salicibibacter cibarius TaxID=2743000 RepID=A0A7T6Z1X7_9BACI|nr:PadR family transcriptional regulator [Salicibibacter cibarius]QQK75293.1 PadR family transcriptional regulator [Salicibibacter cibarius]
MSQTQMLKGIMDGCLLAIIKDEECYGYEMASRLNRYGFINISEGTIYPSLLRMQKEDLVTSTRRKSTAGPQRKYYRLTQKGEEALEEFLMQWNELSKNVNSVINKEVTGSEVDSCNM